MPARQTHGSLQSFPNRSRQQLAPDGTQARVATVAIQRETSMKALPVSGRERTSAPLVLRADVDAIAVLTLNRPQARNSLSEALMPRRPISSRRSLPTA